MINKKFIKNKLLVFVRGCFVIVCSLKFVKYIYMYFVFICIFLYVFMYVNMVNKYNKRFVVW